MKQFGAVSMVSILALALAVPASFAKDKKNDPEEIGNRDVGKGVNFYSLEKEIALGKQLGAGSGAPGEDRRRPGDRRVRQPRGPEPGAQLRRQGSVHDQSARLRRGERVRAAGRLLLREFRPDPEGR